MLTFVLAAVPVLALGGYAWWKLRRSGEPVPLSCRCPHCDKKVRYAVTQAGRVARCPACRRCLPLLAVQTKPATAEKPTAGYKVQRKYRAAS
jgi:hypothetical protein